MARIVIDCNILISAGLTNGVCRQVLFEVVKNHELVVSDLILAEYKAVAARLKFKSVKPVLLELISIVEEVSSKINDFALANIVIPDPKDLIYLHAAINSQAQYLITGNIKDFPEIKYGNFEVLLPKDFLLRLSN
jgi:putative PIN family toxin of toxin-antitoxin system